MPPCKYRRAAVITCVPVLQSLPLFLCSTGRFIRDWRNLWDHKVTLSQNKCHSQVFLLRVAPAVSELSPPPSCCRACDGIKFPLFTVWIWEQLIRLQQCRDAACYVFLSESAANRRRLISHAQIHCRQNTASAMVVLCAPKWYRKAQNSTGEKTPVATSH